MTSAPAASPEAERARGYGRWNGERSAQIWRWWVIARGNLALAWSNRWVKVLMVASLVPGIIAAGVTYFFLPLSAQVLDSVMHFTIVSCFLVAAVVGARLVSDDRRQGAFLAHFARPVTRIDYVAGKFVALLLPLLVVTIAPPLFAVGASLAVDSDRLTDQLADQGIDPRSIPDEQGFLTAADPWGASGAVLAYGLVASATTAGIVLGISALATRARIAGLLWFAIVALGSAAKAILQRSLGAPDWPALLSWSDALGDISSFLVGFHDQPSIGRALEFTLAARIALLAALAAAGLLVVHEQLRRAEGGAR
ncbi:MAG TPA: hypothetical protein VM370_01250 [Candidatus Thermoplasmatota archaeon]|nr:hypothetical protein [Candidatus Thermoplasmatota archaeon]